MVKKEKPRNLPNLNLMIIVVCIFCSINLIVAIDNGVGLTPPMGWNAWNFLRCSISEEKVKKTVDKMVELGLDKKGYQYINLDDCWQIARNHQTGQIIPDPEKFPSGMSELAKYIHSKGLKFGLYSDAGYLTCQKRPGSLGYEQIDARTYANWGVDYLKYDNCYPSPQSSIIRYTRMHRALNSTNRPIFFSMCNWGVQFPPAWGGQIANSWRTTGDIEDKWDSLINILDSQQNLEIYAGQGEWNDPDMLQVGNGGMSLTEYQAHFVMWCALKAPLLIGCDLDKINKDILNILANEQMIAVNQDKLGIQARRVKRINFSDQIIDVYGGPLSNNKYIVIFFNRGWFNAGSQISLKKQLQLRYTSYTQRDPLRHEDIKQSRDDILKVPLIGNHSVQVRILQIRNERSQNEFSVLHSKNQNVADQSLSFQASLQ